MTKTIEQSLEHRIVLEGREAELTFLRKIIPLDRYYGDEPKDHMTQEEFVRMAEGIFAMPVFTNLRPEYGQNESEFVIRLANSPSEEVLSALAAAVLGGLRTYYAEHPVHITRMFGSYILLAQQDGKLKAQRATPIPIRYCPLMVRLLKEVGGDVAEEILETLNSGDEARQQERMIDLIDQVVIAGGYFDTGRPLNSCEMNVLFGASETMYSAFQSGLIDASVIVSNNLGTIITTNAEGTQGAVQRMTGLFYTSPSAEIQQKAEEAGIIPVYPATASIDQVAGVKEAIRRGYKKIAVSVASSDNILHRELRRIEEETGTTIYRFGLCSTGISEEAADAMAEDADIVWTCASKWVREKIEPRSLLQVGIKIPVHMITERGIKLAGNHLSVMDPAFSTESVLTDIKSHRMVLTHQKDGHFKLFPREELRDCEDCPHPCV